MSIPHTDVSHSVDALAAWARPPRAFLHDSARCLALARQRRLKVLPQGLLDLVDWRCPFILPTLPAAGRGEEQAPAFSFMVRLLQAAELLHPEAEWLVGDQSVATWLNQPPATQLLRLRCAWWERLIWDATAIPALRLPTWLERRWPALITTTCATVAACPATAWTPAANLRLELERAGLLAAPGLADNLPAVRRVADAGLWGVASFLIHVALPRLGLLELARVDGQPHLRPTAESRAWLRIALERRAAVADTAHALELDIPYHELQFPGPAAPPVTVTLAADPADAPDAALDVQVTLAAPAACTFVLTHIAAPLPPADASSPGIPETLRYRLTRGTVARGVEWGYPVREVLFLLARWNAGELDPAVVRQLWMWDATQHTLACEPGYRLHGDAAVLAALRARKAFRRRVRPMPGGASVWISATAAPALWAYLRRRGYTLPALTPAAQPPAPGGAGAGALPVSAMLVAARTYQHLRTYLPRLADVSLDVLLRDLETATPPGERVALGRLLASQEAILAQALGRAAPAGPASHPLPPLDLMDLAHLENVLETAIANAAGVALTYIDAHAQVTHRQVKPLRFEDRPPHRYLVAHCALRDEERHFRLDRIVFIAT